MTSKATAIAKRAIIREEAEGSIKTNTTTVVERMLQADIAVIEWFTFEEFHQYFKLLEFLILEHNEYFE